MSKPNGKWSYNFSWSEPYPKMEGFGLWDNPYIRQVAQKNAREEATAKEMSLLESTDKLVDEMLTYPDAEAIMNKIKEANND